MALLLLACKGLSKLPVLNSRLPSVARSSDTFRGSFRGQNFPRKCPRTLCRAFWMVPQIVYQYLEWKVFFFDQGWTMVRYQNALSLDGSSAGWGHLGNPLDLESSNSLGWWSSGACRELSLRVLVRIPFDLFIKVRCSWVPKKYACVDLKWQFGLFRRIEWSFLGQLSTLSVRDKL